MSKKESTYLDMCPELAHIVDAAQGGERAALENVTKHCILSARELRRDAWRMVKSSSCKLPSRTLNTPAPDKK
jgi:hypothetical protein